MHFDEFLEGKMRLWPDEESALARDNVFEQGGGLEHDAARPVDVQRAVCD
jgi:hypothetical protein